MPKAAGLAATIKTELGIESKLVPGKGGQFDVEANGTLCFSKAKALRFPDGEEVLASLRALGS